MHLASISKTAVEAVCVNQGFLMSGICTHTAPPACNGRQLNSEASTGTCSRLLHQGPLQLQLEPAQAAEYDVKQAFVPCTRPQIQRGIRHYMHADETCNAQSRALTLAHQALSQTAVYPQQRCGDCCSVPSS